MVGPCTSAVVNCCPINSRSFWAPSTSRNECIESLTAATCPLRVKIVSQFGDRFAIPQITRLDGSWVLQLHALSCYIMLSYAFKHFQTFFNMFHTFIHFLLFSYTSIHFHALPYASIIFHICFHLFSYVFLFFLFHLSQYEPICSNIFVKNGHLKHCEESYRIMNHLIQIISDCIPRYSQVLFCHRWSPQWWLQWSWAQPRQPSEPPPSGWTLLDLSMAAFWRIGRKLRRVEDPEELGDVFRMTCGSIP